MNSLLPLNATTLERDLEKVGARIDDVPIVHGTLWNADTCPTALLPWLAWTFSVDEWDSGWSENVQRDVIRQSLEVHRIKGTRGAVERAIRSLRASVKIIEWFEVGGSGVPGTFTIDVYANEAIIGDSVLLSPRLYDTIDRLVTRTKRKSAHHTLRVGVRFDNDIGIAAVLNDSSFGVKRESMEASYQPAPMLSPLAAFAVTESFTIARFQMEA